MGMFDPRQAQGRGMLDPAMMQRMAALRALIQQDPTGTAGTMQPTGMTPSWQQFDQANPLPQASVQGGLPPGMAPPGMPSMPPPGGMGMPPQGNMGMPTYSQQMDQAQQPQMQQPQQPQQPTVAPGEPGEAAAADPFFQALAGMAPTLGGCDAGGPDMLPNTASFPTSPSVPRGGPIPRGIPRRRAKVPSESDRLNAQMLASILARRGTA